MERGIQRCADNLTAEIMRDAKGFGFSDSHIAALTGMTEKEVSDLRKAYKVMPDFKLVDTCAAEFQAHTPYYYSTYDAGREL